MNSICKKTVAAFIVFIIFALTFADDIVHVIEKGDTLYSLGRKYGVSVEEICAYNNITDSSKIKLGQKIKIPSINTNITQVQDSKPAETSAPAYTEYPVKPGDTLFSIAKKYDTSVDEIRQANGMSASSTLKSGKILKIPVKQQPTVVAVTEKKNETKNEEVKAAPVKLEDSRSYKTVSVSGKTVWPVKTSEVNYISGKTNSVLLNANKGDDVTAVKGGNVIFSGLYRGFGQVVFVQPKSSDYVYVYSGLDSISVKKGDSVEYGTVLGTVGVDTLSKKPQLNFMVFKNGNAVDPATAPRG